MEVHQLPVLTLRSPKKNGQLHTCDCPSCYINPFLLFLYGFNSSRPFFPFAKGFPIDGFAFAIAI